LSANRPSLPRPNLRLSFTLLTVAALAVAFLAGPSGLFSIWSRSRRAHRLERDISELQERIRQRSAVRSDLADPRKAEMIARQALGADSVPADSAR
jgi:hypothetical protein